MNFSLNMVHIDKIPPCFRLEKIHHCKIGWDVFSSHILCGIIKKHHKELGIESGSELPKEFAKCLDSNNKKIKGLAHELANEFGRHLALVIYLAKQLEEVSDFETEDFRKFKATTNFIVGGGLAEGRLGEVTLRSANEMLNKVHCDVLLEQYPYAAYMPMVGCAVLCQFGKSLVFDFGQTYMKSAVITINDGRVTSLEIQEKIHSLYMDRNIQSKFFRKMQGARLDKYVKNYLLSVIESNKNNNISQLTISFAGKVSNGELLQYGAYGKLEEAFPRYRENIENYLSKKLSRNINVTLVNDEQAAAIAISDYDGLSITLGTAFGLGEPQHNIEINRCTDLIIV